MALLHVNYFSDVLGLSTSLDLILPQPTRQQIGMEGAREAGPYKALYLLHGLSDDHTIWQRRTSIERYVAPLPLAVVMPNAHRSFYTDMADGPRYFEHLADEVPALCETWFPLSGEREDTFVAGLSMGGYGAFKLALGRPERFAAGASLSGALDVRRRINIEERQPEMRRIFGDPATVAGSDNDLFALAERVVGKGPRPRLFAWCGQEDFLYQENLDFRDHAQQLGLELEYREGPGDHSWGYWDEQIQAVLNWLGV